MRDRLLIIAGLVVFVGLAAFPIWYAALANATVNGPVLQMPVGQTQCVRDKEWMLHNHMKLLMHERDAVVHQGARNTNESLPGCVRCHVNRLADGSYPSVTSRQFFCNGCHGYVGVKIDCFSCHANHPEQGEVSRAGETGSAESGIRGQLADSQRTEGGMR